MTYHLRTLFSALVIACLMVNPHPSRASAPPPGRQYVFLIDLSASRNPDVIKEDEVLMRQVIAQANANDRFVVMQMQDVGLATRPRHWEAVMPSPKDPAYASVRERQSLTAAQANMLSLVPSFFAVRGGAKVNHTDIFTTLQVADEYVRDSAGRATTIVLLSDMLQSANGIEMEHLAHMPAAKWIPDHQRDGLMPHFGGACVAVIGADPTTKEGRVIMTFWRSYFSATGASLTPQHYRVTPPSSGANVCN